MKNAAAATSASHLLRRVKRHAAWLLLAFFLTLSWLTASNLRKEAADRRNAVAIHAWTENAVAASRLIHELQKERGMSSGFVASSGSAFRDELTAQHERTDAAVAQVRELVRRLPPEAEAVARLSWESLDDVAALVAARRHVVDLQLSRDATVAHYGAVIDRIFGHMLETMSVGDIGWMVRQQMAFLLFLQTKEMAGQERALVTAMLASADFSAVRMNAFHQIKATERFNLQRFFLLADAQAQEAYRQIEAPGYVAQAERIRRLVVAIGASGERPEHPLSDAGLWFELATKRIDTMNAIEQTFSARLLDRAGQLEAEAQRGLWLNGLLSLASFLIAAALIAHIWRGKQIAERNLQLAAEVFGNSIDSIFITDADARIIDTNPAFTGITGYAREDVVGRNPSLFQSGRHDSAFYAALWQQLLQTGGWKGEVWNRRKNGEIYPALQSIAAVKDARGQTTHYIATTVDLSKFKETENLVEELRTFDALTGLPNRDAWHSAVDQAVAAARATNGRFAVLDIGLDRFKAINESFGHAVGDEVLIAAAHLIKQTLRRHDVTARPSGNRFSVLIQDFAEPAEVGAYCEKLLAAFAVPLRTSAHGFSQAISVGIALYPDDGRDTRQLLQNAESALHAAQDVGNAGYAFYSKDMNAASAKLLAIEQMMRLALERGEFSLVYQPQVDARSGALVGAEALLRWHNAELGAVSPVQFIPIAETTGLIVPIGEWVLEQACRQAQQWRGEFGRDIPMAVNLSARQFVREDLMVTVQQALDRSGLPPRLLELEITEGLLMNDPVGAADIMRGLRAMGLKLALDDFGTGYSSLAYLKSFPLDRLKLDRAFVTDLAESKDDRAIAATVVALGRHLGVQVLAEGVETEAQRDYLVSIGCDVFQGYLFGKPMAPVELTRAVRAGSLGFAAPGAA